MSLLLVIFLSAFSYQHEVGRGLIVLESEDYIAKYDTSSGSSGDHGWEDIWIVTALSTLE